MGFGTLVMCILPLLLLSGALQCTVVHGIACVLSHDKACVVHYDRADMFRNAARKPVAQVQFLLGVP